MHVLPFTKKRELYRNLLGLVDNRKQSVNITYSTSITEEYLQLKKRKVYKPS